MLQILHSVLHYYGEKQVHIVMYHYYCIGTYDTHWCTAALDQATVKRQETLPLPFSAVQACHAHADGSQDVLLGTAQSLLVQVKPLVPIPLLT